MISTRRMLKTSKTFGILAIASALLACDSQSSSKALAAPKGSTVSIIDVQPSTGQALTVGDKVALKIKVAYALTSESGNLGVVVQDDSNTPLAQKIHVVLKGGGTEEFNLSFEVPNTNAIHIFTPLSAPDQPATSTMSTRSYRVKAK
jgi:hypothetical protein